MPRHTHPPRRRSKPTAADRVLADREPTADELARLLVARGLASHHILGELPPGQRSIDLANPAQKD